MINVFVSCANETTEEWESVCIIPLKPSSELHPDTPVSADWWGINDYEFFLPNKEPLKISAAFTESNNSISFGLSKENKSLVSVYCVKRDLDAHDSTMVFHTPNGLEISIVFGHKT